MQTRPQKFLLKPCLVKKVLSFFGIKVSVSSVVGRNRTTKMPEIKYLIPFILVIPTISALTTHIHHDLENHPDGSSYKDKTIYNYERENHFHSHLYQRHIHELEFTPAPQGDILCPGDSKRICVPYIRCPAHLRSSKLNCKLAEGSDGVCCSADDKYEIPKGKSRASKTIKKDDLHRAIASGRSQVSALLQKESKLMVTGRSAFIRKGTPSFGHFRNFHITNPVEQHRIMELSNHALEITLTTRALKDSEGLSPEDIEIIPNNLRGTSLEAACAHPPICPQYNSRFSNIDGSCNNPLDSSLGMAQSPYSRLLPPSYEDGIWSPRMSKIHGQHLPSPRLISTTLFSDADKPDYEHTLMLMQFGQFLSHDTSRSIPTRFANGSGISCCTNDGLNEHSAEMRHYACMPIIVSPQDNFYKSFGQRCMNFVRSVLAPRHECNLGYSQQMNRVTHFLDGSAIYGTDAETLNSLREFADGKLKMFKDFDRDLLPLSTKPGDCLTTESGSACFAAGDSRCNQMISLIALHILFAREHNRLADELASLNPHWTDEILFWEARRIVVAEIQHITYSQWLPEVIGHKAMSEFGLNVDKYDYSMNYDPNIDPSITNEFTTAAMRFGHSIVDGKMKIYGPTKMEEIIDIPDVMFNPSKIRKREYLDEILSTLTVDSPQTADIHVSDSLTQYMFRGGFPFGLDLISINIQRGRDHGIRAYNEYRELIKMKHFYHFDEFGKEASGVLSSLYASPEDVDLYVGGLLENRVPGAIVGPTFLNIIADQFVRLRKGDKYFYDLHPTVSPGHFSYEQLREIKHSSLSRIICDNSDGILLVKQAPNPFRKPGLPGNDMVDCSNPSIPHLNLIYWQEKI